MAKDDVLTSVRVYDESQKRVNWQNLQSEVMRGEVKCDKDKGIHYFHYGQKKCVCGKFDGSTPLEAKKEVKKK